MAVVKFQVGAEWDLLNRAELDAALDKALQSWAKEIGRGVRFREFSGRGNVVGGVWTIDGHAAGQTLGPAEGMVWAITRAAISGNGVVVGTDLWSLYSGEVSPSKLVESRLLVTRYFDVPNVVLAGGNCLVATGVGTGAGADVTLSGQAVELPVQLAWQLL